MVDLKKIQTLDQLVPQQPGKVKQPDLGGMGPSFKETLQDVVGTKPQNIGQVNPQGLRQGC